MRSDLVSNIKTLVQLDCRDAIKVGLGSSSTLTSFPRFSLPCGGAHHVLELLSGRRDVRSQPEKAAGRPLKLVAGDSRPALAYPFDVVKTRLAAQSKTIVYKGIWDCIHSISKEEGPPGFYRGWSMTMAYAIPSVGLNFMVFDAAKRTFFPQLIDEKTGKLPTIPSLICGATAGFVGSAVMYPLDLVRRQMQMTGFKGRPMIHRSNWEAFQHVYSNDNGIRGFYRGIVPELAKVVPNIAISFCVFEQLMKKKLPFEDLFDDPPPAQVKMPSRQKV
eukprot:gene955-63_t